MADYLSQLVCAGLEDGGTWLSYVEGAVKHPMARELLQLEHHRFGGKFVAFAGINPHPYPAH